MASQPAIPSPTPSALEGDIARLRAMQAQNNHQGALDQAMALLAQFPENRDLLLIAASALRHLRRTDDALAMLDRLATHHPDYSQLFQERGLCHVARRDAPQAIAALQAAVAINPALPMAWRMLDGLWRMTGDMDNAAIGARNCAHLASLPPQVVQAKIHFGDGEIDLAEMVVRQFLLTKGDHPEAMRVLGQIGMVHKVYDDAQMLFAGVLSLVPDHHDVRREYVEALIARHKFAEARKALAPLLAMEPGNIQNRTHAATIAIGLGEHEQAIALYKTMLAELGHNPQTALRIADFNLWMGHALKAIGEQAQAIVAYQAAIAISPTFGEAWWSLANLKIYRFADDQIAQISRAEADPTVSAIDKVHLAFALGKALEDRGDYENSWAAYARGNAARHADVSYRPEMLEQIARDYQRVGTPAFFDQRRDWGRSSTDPIFVVGLPRSGSTLIEQILASHSQVEGTQELPDIHNIVQHLQGRDLDLDNPRYPAALADLDADAVARFAAQYLDDTRAYRIMGRPFFIDKMPNNFRHIGLIHLILPNATIIDARRNPMDCCFSNLKQLFAQGQEFTYSIEDIARYYRTYLDLMRHWDAVLPGRVLRVINEDLIDDPEGQIRRLLDHCGLPFEEGCLNFHQTRRSVRTPSSEQVRRPISRAGVDQWKPYAQWLGPLADALGDALETWRD